METKKQEQQKKSKSVFYSVFVVTGSVTILLVIPVVALSFIGMWMDKIFHTGYLFLIGGALIAFVGGMSNIYRLLKTLS